MVNKMTHKEMIHRQMQEYVKEYGNKVRFIGYNTAKGPKMYGTLDGLEKYCIEMPVCENLMVGMALGMSLEGYRPVVCFERHDFLLIGLDQLVNHVDKLAYISNWKVKVPVLVRAIVGAGKPLFPGVQHTQEYTVAIASMLKHTRVIAPATAESYTSAVALVGKTDSGAVVVVEYRDEYEMELAD